MDIFDLKMRNLKQIDTFLAADWSSGEVPLAAAGSNYSFPQRLMMSPDANNQAVGS